MPPESIPNLTELSAAAGQRNVIPVRFNCVYSSKINKKSQLCGKLHITLYQSKPTRAAKTKTYLHNTKVSRWLGNSYSQTYSKDRIRQQLTCLQSMYQLLVPFSWGQDAIPYAGRLIATFWL